MGAETRTFSVTVDKCASFPVFFKATADWLVFAPEVGALVRSGPAPEPDETGIAQMLVNGHLLGDATLATGVRRMQGGETLSVARGEVSRRRWWRFAPGALCARDRSVDLSAEMSARIHTAVARHLEDPGDAAVFLSGGADSRAIFGCALRAAGGSGVRLRTVSWSAGEESSEGSDAAIARRLAAVAGARHSFVRREVEAALIPRVVTIIGGLSEMAAFHAHEIRIMEGLRGEGIARVLRGDEVFGYHGAVESIDQALDAIYIGRLVRSPVCRALLRRKLDAPFCARDEAALQGGDPGNRGILTPAGEGLPVFQSPHCNVICTPRATTNRPSWTIATPCLTETSWISSPWFRMRIAWRRGYFKTACVMPIPRFGASRLPAAAVSRIGPG